MIKSAKLNGTNKTCMILKLSQIVLGFFHMRIITRLYKSCVYEREREREREPAKGREPGPKLRQVRLRE